MTALTDPVSEMAHRMLLAYLREARVKLGHAAEFPYPDIFRTPEVAGAVRACRAALDTLDRFTHDQGEGL